MNDLVKRLREAEEGEPLDPMEQELMELCGKAADRIEQLEEIVREVIAGRYDDALLLTANLEDIDED